ncbi:hypothetical protein EX30DRAFT_397523 [Ascodesmis nigricans]|uniref:Chromatin remodeling complex subunit n=1 Tax=Ascodesmis nigricans TaxID=341454 RepID=A0A4S2MRR8_9PEZI|nr:hypothetical protein EX30DRAFT_397523 [Ascodesmis nigricans]
MSAYPGDPFDEDEVMEDVPPPEPDNSDGEDYQQDADVPEQMDIDSEHDDDNVNDEPLVPINYIDEFPRPKAVLEVSVPTLEELGTEQDEYLVPAKTHMLLVTRVMKELRKNGSLCYKVQLADGSVTELSFVALLNAQNGSRALTRYTQGPGAGSGPEEIEEDLDEDEDTSVRRSLSINTDRATRQRTLESLRQLKLRQTEDDEDDKQPIRRSTRSRGPIKQITMLAYGDGFDSDDDLVVSDLNPPQKTRNRRATLNIRRRHHETSEDEASSHDKGKRRSGRTKRQKQRYTDVDPNLEEEIFRSDTTAPKPKPRITHSEEVFPLLDSSNEFVRAHNDICDACGIQGPSHDRGNLLYCQGCSMCYHKTCIGHRSGREHLVTKISPVNFVLQCRRCIGRAKTRDASLPSLNRCTGCGSTGRSCAPFKSLRKPNTANRGERELTPDTEVPEHLLYAQKNVLFRCTGCYRAWHYNHLPDRHTKVTGDTNLWKTRMLQYTTDFKCTLCTSSPLKISHIVAWRPADPHARKHPVLFEDFTEDNREYLVKFENQSYFKVVWVPGGWVTGRAPKIRTAFVRKNMPAKFTTEEAVNEEWLRIEICLDVKYTSYIPLGKDVDVDLRRISEVSQAYVKYRGLGYEDAVWEEPPTREEKERHGFWEKAYANYIHGFYVRPPKNVAKRVEKAKAADFEELKEQPEYIRGGTLMPYQIEGFNWLYYRWWKSQNVVLADEMGLGKTIQIISFLAVLHEEQQVWPFLIVVPHSTAPNWKREFETWAPGLKVVSYSGLEVSRKLIKKYEMINSDTGELKCHVVIVSYSQPTNAEDARFLRRFPWEVMVVDEGQRLKNDSSIMYKELEKFNIRHKILLTGTPLQNNIRELFNLLQFLDPKSVSAQDLEEEYMELDSEKVNELHNMLRPFFLRRTKAEVLTHIIPPMSEIIVPVTMSTLQRKLYKSILSKDPALIKSILYRGDASANAQKKERAKLNNLLMQLRKCVCHPFLYNQSIEEQLPDRDLVHQNLVDASSKLTLLSLLLPKLQSQGHRVLIFSQFLGMLDIIEDFLDHLSFSYRRLDGSTSTLEKQKHIDAFNSPGSTIFAFLLSTRAGGVGINLATADTVIILDPDFNPHQDIQALSRAHRIGQKNKVLCMRLVTRDTVEQKILDIGKKKRTMDHLIVERMAANTDDDEDIDVESILRHGVESLFEDNVEERNIVYDDASVEKLLNRENIENTITRNDGPTQAEASSFSFARVWQNETGTLVIDNPDEETEAPVAPPVGFWEKVLQQREEEARLEALAKEAEMAKGRKRKVINYAAFDGPERGAGGTNESGGDSDTDFREEGGESEDESVAGAGEDFGEDVRGLANTDNKHAAMRGLLGPNHQQHQSSSSMMAPVAPISHPQPPQPPHSSTTKPPPPPLPSTIDPLFPRPTLPTPTSHPSHPLCRACRHHHAPSLCPLRTAVELCPLCNLAHYGEARACPHLKSETQVTKLLEALGRSGEDVKLVEMAKRYLENRRRTIQRNKRERLEKEKREGERREGKGKGKGRV